MNLVADLSLRLLLLPEASRGDPTTISELHAGPNRPPKPGLANLGFRSGTGGPEGSQRGKGEACDAVRAIELPMRHAGFETQFKPQKAHL